MGKPLEGNNLNRDMSTRQFLELGVKSLIALWATKATTVLWETLPRTYDEIIAALKEWKLTYEQLFQICRDNVNNFNDQQKTVLRWELTKLQLEKQKKSTSGGKEQKQEWVEKKTIPKKDIVLWTPEIDAKTGRIKPPYIANISIPGMKFNFKDETFTLEGDDGQVQLSATVSITWKKMIIMAKGLNWWKARVSIWGAKWKGKLDDLEINEGEAIIDLPEGASAITSNIFLNKASSGQKVPEIIFGRSK